MNTNDQSGERRLTFVIHELSGGGAERVLVDLANEFGRRGDAVTLITLGSDANDAYDVDDRVHRVALDLMSESSNAFAAMTSNLRRLRRLRIAIRQSRADWVISFTDQINVLTVIATLGMGIPVIISDRVDPRRHPLGRAWTRLRSFAYPRCAAAVAQTESVRSFIKQLVGSRPVEVIPNPVRPLNAEPTLAASGSPTIVAMGRLVDQKGFDLLIEAFARIAPNNPSWNLKILGEGPDLEKLVQLCERQAVRDRVEFAGWTPHPHLHLMSADVFVLSSRYEGFPNALLDAMLCGVPVVSFNCDSGPSDIVRDDVDGFLVPAEDVSALAAAMETLIRDDKLRSRMGEAAREVERRFSIDSVIAKWNRLLEKVAPERQLRESRENA